MRILLPSLASGGVSGPAAIAAPFPAGSPLPLIGPSRGNGIRTAARLINGGPVANRRPGHPAFPCGGTGCSVDSSRASAAKPHGKIAGGNLALNGGLPAAKV
jgi:hypothetical protein